MANDRKALSIEDIKSRVTIKDVLEHYAVKVNRGNFCPCQFHGDKAPSMKVYYKQNRVHCFGCGLDLDQIDYVAEMEKLTITATLDFMDNAFKLGLGYKVWTKTEIEEIERKKRMREAELQKAKRMEEFLKEVCDKIVKKLHVAEDIERRSRWNESIDRDKWDDKLSTIYFKALQQIKWLEWLWAVLNEQSHPLCEYHFYYGDNQIEILRKLWKKEIQI